MADLPGSAPVGRVAHPVLGRGRGWLLLAGVTLVHLLGAERLAEDRFGWGERDRQVARIEVAFVRELAQAAAPVAAPAPPPAAAERRLPAVAERPAVPASAAAATAPEPEPAAMPAVVVPASPAPQAEPALARVEPAPAPQEPAAAMPPPAEPVPPPQVPPAINPVAAAAPAAAAPVSASASAVPAFDWPPSTQLSYTLQGYYRGPVDGSAQVEWVRSGTHYQVRMRTSAGPLIRTGLSDGELTPTGLQPRRFEGEQRVMFMRGRRWSQQFGSERITLADGTELPTLPGAQDEASQFVQLTWLFTTQPSLLQVGRSIEVPLMINRRLDRWIYDVTERQTLHFSFGPVETFYVKPRREARPGSLTAEIWFAPSLQYLPVRILIRQDEATHMDLMLEKPPLQAAGEPARR